MYRFLLDYPSPNHVFEAGRLPAISRRRFLGLAAGSVLAVACGVPDPSSTSSPAPPGARASSSSSQLLVAVQGEPRTLVPFIGGTPGNAAEHLFELLHQSLMTYDDQARPLPRLAQELPSLDRGTWRVHDDGAMETVWRLRDDAFWHDGTPFTAEDVLFSWRVFRDPTVPVASRRAVRLIDEMEAPDRHTVVMRWRSRYAFADQLSATDLTILPSHVLGASFELRREQLASHPYFRSEFVGLGPFRLARWLSGSFMELEAFDRYFLGAPRFPAVSVRFYPDDNSAMAAALSGNVDMVLPRRARIGVARSMRQTWSDGTEGVLSVIPGFNWVFLAPQFVGSQPADVADIRVRQALAHALDRRAIAEAVVGDGALASEVWIPSTDPGYQRLVDGIGLYSYDPIRAQELFREAGWRREANDDVLVKQGRRFELELTSTQGLEQASAVIAGYWREVGIAVRQNVLSLGAAGDRRSRATYDGVELVAGPPNFSLLDGRLHSANAPAAENQFVGANRGHYASREMDARLERFWMSLLPAERDAAERDIARQISAELPIIGLFFYPSMAMTRSSVRNSRPPTSVSPVGRILLSWNAHEWERGS